jgi:ribosomal-protein-alanine N-acetyltransferase
MRIVGPRLALRPPRMDDAGALFELGRDPEVVRFFSWGPYRERAEAEAFIERVLVDRPHELLIVDSGDRPIGLTGLSELSERDGRAVVGTWLGRAHWGSGANRESKALILHFAFRTLDLGRVSAYAHPDNARSLVALERVGFVREGLLRGWHVHRGERRDVVMLGLLREEWEAGPLASVPVRVEAPPRLGPASS